MVLVVREFFGTRDPLIRDPLNTDTLPITITATPEEWQWSLWPAV